MTRRRAPRPAGDAIRNVLDETAPRTLLAEVQTAWPGVCGDAVAAEARPVAERDGVITVACRSSTWASELDLIQATLVERLNAAVSSGPVTGLRFTADAARHE
jgi:predicted nucleic acid-binding Zn ribbon protein